MSTRLSARTRGQPQRRRAPLPPTNPQAAEADQRALFEALELHRCGELEAAEAAYLRLLESPAVRHDALHLLANLYKQRGQTLEALMRVNEAIALVPHALFFNTRGAILLDFKRPRDALDDLRRAFKLIPNNYELLVNLAAAHRELREHRKALSYAQQATALNPALEPAWINLGAIALDRGDKTLAAHCFGEALARNSRHPIACLNLAKVRFALELESLPIGAEPSALAPSDETLALFARAAAEAPNSFEAQARYAAMLARSKRLTEAVEPLVRAFEIARRMDLRQLTQDAELLSTFFQVSTVLRMLERHVLQERAWRRLTEAVPDVALFWANLGQTYLDQQRFDEADRCFAEALRLDPNHIPALQARAASYGLRGRLPEALADYEHILKLQPDHVGVMAQLFAERLRSADWNAEPWSLARLRERLLALNRSSSANAINTFIMLSLTDQASEQLRNACLAAQQVEAPYLHLHATTALRAPRSTGRIGLGYLSNDFRQHPLGVLAAELFRLHDPSRFEVTAYNTSPDDGSTIRQRIQRSAERWVDLTQATIVEMADRIRADGCEILIDLTGNTRGGRPQLMCLRPAPVQGIWLGFIGTMGSDYYDLLIADTTTIPEEHFPHYKEKILRLPQTFQINDPLRPTPRLDVRREEYGFTEADLILCSFNQAYKTQPELFAVWMDILRELPEAKLWLLEDNPWASANWRAAAAALGVDPQRIVIGPRLPPLQHLERYVLADLALDTYPVNSGATASDALFAGCPIVTCLGHSMASRMCASLLYAVGLGELVTGNFEHYARKVLELARSRERLRAMKQRLLEQRAQLPLFDAARLVRDLEWGLERIAERLRRGIPLDHITVPAERAG